MVRLLRAHHERRFFLAIQDDTLAERRNTLNNLGPVPAQNTTGMTKTTGVTGIQQIL